MTVRECLKQIRIRLHKAGIECFEYESWIFLEWKLGIRRADYYLNPSQPVTSVEWEDLNKDLIQREKRVPLQYLMKSCEFMGYSFYVDEHVLIPRQDTELLVELAVAHIKQTANAKEKYKVLDLCTGSGCIGISVKCLCPKTEMTLVDISPDALKVASRNAEQLKAEVALLQSDLFEHVEKKYDCILSNPPYIPTKVIDNLMPEVRDYEPHLALDGAEDGLYFYRKIVKQVSGFLNPGGMLLFEIGAEQGQALRKLMEAAGFLQIEIRQDLAGLDRVVMGICAFS